MTRNGVEEESNEHHVHRAGPGDDAGLDASLRDAVGPVRAGEGVRDTLFALALLALVAGVAGFVTMEARPTDSPRGERAVL